MRRRASPGAPGDDQQAGRSDPHVGDPISVVGSPAAGTWSDGSTIYSLGWRKLLAGSATGEAVRVSPDGSRLLAA